jgi:hypothetical protein
VMCSGCEKLAVPVPERIYCVLDDISSWLLLRSAHAMLLWYMMKYSAAAAVAEVLSCFPGSAGTQLRCLSPAT